MISGACWERTMLSLPGSACEPKKKTEKEERDRRRSEEASCERERASGLLLELRCVRPRWPLEARKMPVLHPLLLSVA